jgi:malonyl-CoA O-methyltransferase
MNRPRSATGLPDKDRLTASFNAAADGYDDIAILQQTVAAALLERLDLMRIRPGWILDLGSGTGNSARELARRFGQARVIQADIAMEMLLQSRRRSRRWLSRQHYLCADAESLPLRDAAIDLVFSSLMLQWCHDLDAVFNRIRLVMRPGGLLLFSSLGPDTLAELRESWRAAGDDEVVHVNSFYDMHDVGDALIRSGFADPVMEAETLTLTYEQVFDLMRELKRVGANNINGGRRRSLTGPARMQRVVAAYEQWRRDGRLPATYEVVYGHAWVPDTPYSRRQPDGSVSITPGSIRRRNPQS